MENIILMGVIGLAHIAIALIILRRIRLLRNLIISIIYGNEDLRPTRYINKWEV